MALGQQQRALGRDRSDWAAASRSASLAFGSTMVTKVGTTGRPPARAARQQARGSAAISTSIPVARGQLTSQRLEQRRVFDRFERCGTAVVVVPRTSGSFGRIAGCASGQPTMPMANNRVTDGERTRIAENVVAEEPRDGDDS